MQEVLEFSEPWTDCRRVVGGVYEIETVDVWVTDKEGVKSWIGKIYRVAGDTYWEVNAALCDVFGAEHVPFSMTLTDAKAKIRELFDRTMPIPHFRRLSWNTRTERRRT